MFADVVLPPNLSRAFTYRIPSYLEGTLQVGSWVVVPFGRTIRQGMVVSVGESQAFISHASKSFANHIKEIQNLTSPHQAVSLDPSLIALAKQLSNFYVAPLGPCLRLIQPPRTTTNHPTRRLTVTDLGKKAQNDSRLSADVQKTLIKLAKAPRGLTLPTLKKHVPSVNNLLPTLKRRGLVQEEQQMLQQIPTPARDPIFKSRGTGKPGDTETKKELRGVQGGELRSQTQSVFFPHTRIDIDRKPWRKAIQQAFKENRHERVLVTVPSNQALPTLLQATQDSLAYHRNALLITPDRDRAQILADQARARWGEKVILFHRGLSESKRHLLWQEIQKGRAKVVIGTRSALFTPLPAIGLIGVDREEEGSYKDDQCPYYHAREVAHLRARHHRAVLFLCTAHPSLETYHAFAESMAFNRMIKNVERHSSPDIQAVNLQDLPFGSVLSEPMLTGISEALAAGGRSIIFLNRKGSSRSLSCQACGFVFQCSRCEVPLTLYQTPPGLVCAYCGSSQSIPVTCPACSGSRLEPIGVGTERLETLLRHHFPLASIARLDRNSIKTPQADRRLRTQFNNGEIHILVGTQMLFSGMPLGSVQFMGIPFADIGLHLPDFRAGERVFHQLQEAVDLTTPKEAGGKVVLQTRLPTHHVIQAITRQNPTLFYHQELAFREALGYPPFSHLIHLQVTGKHVERTLTGAKKWAGILLGGSVPVFSRNDALPLSSESVLGPVPSLFPRVRGKYRYKILVKAKDVDQTRELIRGSLPCLQAEEKELRFSVNVDPMEMF